jgi:hypothetical protein
MRTATQDSTELKTHELPVNYLFLELFFNIFKPKLSKVTETMETEIVGNKRLLFPLALKNKQNDGLNTYPRLVHPHFSLKEFVAAVVVVKKNDI